MPDAWWSSLNVQVLLQLPDSNGVCCRNKSRQGLCMSLCHCLFSCLYLGRNVVEGFLCFRLLSPLCAKIVCFNSKISHAYKLGAKSVGWWLWRGCSHKWWLLLNETKSLLAACRLKAAEKGYAEGSWLCFFDFGQLLIWCHCLNTVPPLIFKWIFTVWTADFVWYVAWFCLPFTCCSILEKKIQLSSLTSVILFGNFCHAKLFPCFRVWTSSSTPVSNYFFYSLQSVKCLSSILSSEVFWIISH